MAPCILKASSNEVGNRSYSYCIIRAHLTLLERAITADVCVSVCPSVCLSVKRVHPDKTGGVGEISE